MLTVPGISPHARIGWNGRQRVRSNPKACLMKSKTLLGLLLALNLLLAGAVAWLQLRQGRGDFRDMAKGQGPATREGQPETKESSESNGAASHSDAFTYRRLLSTDLRKYIALLRKVSCPESTVQDIILAEIQRRYASREAALGVHRQHQNPWDPQPPGGGRDWKKWTRLRELREEKRALVQDLLGIEIPLGLPNWSLDSDPALERALAGIPEGKRQAAKDLLERYRDQRREIEERTGGFLLPEDAEAYRKTAVARRQEMEALLGVEAFEKFDLESSSTGRALRSRFEGFELSENELRGLFRSQRAVDELQVPGQILGQTPEQAEEFNREFASALPRAQQEIQNLRASMSPERQVEFDRVQDSSYRQTLQRVSQAGLPRETAVQVYEFGRSLRNEMTALLQAPNSDPQQRQQALQQFYQGAEQRLRDALGNEAFDRIGGLGRIPGIPRFSAEPNLLQRYGLVPGQ